MHLEAGHCRPRGYGLHTHTCLPLLNKSVHRTIFRVREVQVNPGNRYYDLTHIRLRRRDILLSHPAHFSMFLRTSCDDRRSL
ncbi:hypothetical protein VTO73DRAFT_4015 [Trametes versicolor]